jgi:hypothetical protein
LLASASIEVVAQARQAAPAAATLQTLEGEALAGSARATVGAAAAQSMTIGAGWSGNAQLLWTGGAAGAVLDIAFDVAAPAVYAVELYFTRAPDYARIAVQIDGNSMVSSLDISAPSVAPPAPFQAGRAPLVAGPHTLSVRIEGKNAQSTGYLVGLDQIRLYPSGALDPAAAPAATTPTVTQAPQNSPVPPVPAAIGVQQDILANAGAGGTCPSTCVGTVSTVYRQDAQGQCQVWFRVPCAPFSCEDSSGVCRAACQSNNDCEGGSVCSTVTGVCSSAPPMCLDVSTVRSANGQSHSCEPYECRAGSCRETCDSSNDCSSGFVCNVYSHCVKKQ